MIEYPQMIQMAAQSTTVESIPCYTAQKLGCNGCLASSEIGEAKLWL